MRSLEPRYYLECPLGLHSQCVEDTTYKHPWKWWACPNASYCRMVAEAWWIPLVRESGKLKVELTYREPHGYSLLHYRKIMKEYGWAEAEDLIFGRTTPDDALRALKNKFSLGYAVAVPLDKVARDILAFYRKDAWGLWWYASGQNELPKDSSDERWRRQARKG